MLGHTKPYLRDQLASHYIFSDCLYNIRIKFIIRDQIFMNFTYYLFLVYAVELEHWEQDIFTTNET